MSEHQVFTVLLNTLRRRCAFTVYFIRSVTLVSILSAHHTGCGAFAPHNAADNFNEHGEKRTTKERKVLLTTIILFFI